MAKEDKAEPRGSHNGESHQHGVGAGNRARNLIDSARSGLGGESGTLMASAAMIGVGALLAPELLGGMLLGAGAVYASRNLSQVSQLVAPLLRGAVKAGYAAASSASELIAEASETVQDTIAEARMEYTQGSHPGSHQS